MNNLINICQSFLQLSLFMTPVLLVFYLVSKTEWMKRRSARDRRLIWCACMIALVLPLASILPTSIKLPNFVKDIGFAQNVGENEAAKAPAQTPAYSEEFLEDTFSSGPAVWDTEVFSDKEAIVFYAPVDVSQKAESTEKTPVANKNPISVALIISIIWLCGIATKLIVNSSKYISFCRNIKKNSLTLHGETKEIYAEACSQMKVVGAPRLVCSSYVTSPAVYGMFRPTLALPETDFSSESLYTVLIHELTHYKKHDLAFKWLAMAAGAVHWFNPAVLWAVKRFDYITELACDEEVLSRLDSTERIVYGETILCIARHHKANRRPVGTLSAHLSTGKTRERISFIIEKTSRKGAKLIGILSLILCLTASMISCKDETVQKQDAKNDDKFSANNSMSIISGVKHSVPGVDHVDVREKVDFTVKMHSDIDGVTYSYSTLTDGSVLITDIENKDGPRYLGEKYFDDVIVNTKITTYFNDENSFFFCDDDRKYACVCVNVKGIVSYQRAILVELESGEILMTVDPPFMDGNHIDAASWFTAHGIEKELYSALLPRIVYDDDGKEVGKISGLVKAGMFPKFYDGSLVLTSTLYSLDEKVSVGGTQVFDLEKRTLTEYTPKTSDFSEGLANVLEIVDSLFGESYLVGGEQLAESAFNGLKVYYGITGDNSLIKMSFPDDRRWEETVRKYFSPELADYVIANKTLPNSTLEFGDCRIGSFSMYMMNVTEGYVHFKVPIETLDPQTGEVIDSAQVVLGFYNDDDVWKFGTFWIEYDESSDEIGKVYYSFE